MRAIGSTLLLLGLCIGVAPSLRATTTFNFTGVASNQGSLGNILTFGTATLSAWSTDGTSNQFRTAELGQYTPGLGVCSNTEATSGGVCQTSGPPEHAVSNELGASGIYDFVLLTFSQNVSSISFVLNPFGLTNQDMDVTYFVGLCTPNSTSCTPSGKTLANLTSSAGLTGHVSTTTLPDGTLNSGLGAATKTLTINFGSAGSSVNWIMLGAAKGQTDDAFKIESVAVVDAPEPATFGMAGAALLALGFLRARKKPSAVS